MSVEENNCKKKKKGGGGTIMMTSHVTARGHICTAVRKQMATQERHLTQNLFGL